MKRKLLYLALIFSILLSAMIGVGSMYFHNEILQTSHKSTYTKEEEIELLDRIIEMVDKNEIEPEMLKKAFASQKKSRTAAHKIMKNSKSIRNNVIAALGFIFVLQLILLHACLKEE